MGTGELEACKVNVPAAAGREDPPSPVGTAPKAGSGSKAARKKRSGKVRHEDSK
jgi:hypothetical protein